MADLIVEGGPWDLSLVDIDQDALNVAYGLCQRMIASRAAPIRLSKHQDRRKALPGADFVATTIAVAGRRGWERDVFIPRKYGVFQPVGDTIMPGGLSRALRQIPAMVAIARDLLDLAPRAILFNYSNPMAAICRAVSKATGARIVGLCHGVKGGERHLADLLGIDPARCQFAAAGMNHLCFFTEFKVDGKEAWTDLRHRLEREDPPAHEYLRRTLFFDCGVYSVLNDRHLCEFFPQFHGDGTHPGGRLGVDIFSFEACIESGDRGYAAMAEQASGEAPLDESILDRQLGEHEELVRILRALDSDAPFRCSVNLPNRGQVTNLPEGLVVETPAEISREGIRPASVGALSPFVRAAVEKALLSVELAVDAALERDQDAFLQAIVADGSVTSLADAKRLAQELWKANEPYLRC